MKREDLKTGNIQEDDPRHFEVVLFFLCCITALYIAHSIIGAKLFLIYLYGWDAVQNEHLTFTDMPKVGPWLVSNGDIITDKKTIHFFITVICWWAISIPLYLLLRRLLPRNRTEEIKEQRDAEVLSLLRSLTAGTCPPRLTGETATLLEILREQEQHQPMDIHLQDKDDSGDYIAYISASHGTPPFLALSLRRYGRGWRILNHWPLCSEDDLPKQPVKNIYSRPDQHV